MGLWSWLRRLFGRKRTATPILKSEVALANVDEDRRKKDAEEAIAKARARITVLNLQQSKWKDAAKRAESERQDLYVAGGRTTDPRQQKECARRIGQLNSNIQHYDDLIAGLEKQKSQVEARIQGVEAWLTAADRAETASQAAEVQRLNEQVDLSQKAQAEADSTIKAAEQGRFESAPQDSAEVDAIFKTIQAAAAKEIPPKAEKE